MKDYEPAVNEVLQTDEGYIICVENEAERPEQACINCVLRPKKMKDYCHQVKCDARRRKDGKFVRFMHFIPEEEGEEKGNE